MVDVNSFALLVHRALGLMQSKESNIGIYEALELPRSGSPLSVIYLGRPHSHERMDFLLLSGPQRQVCWGVYAPSRGKKLLRDCCEYEFGDLPALDGGAGHFDSPAWRLVKGRLFITVAPSDSIHTEVPAYMVDVAAEFFRIVARRLRLGIPSSIAKRGGNLQRVITHGHLCPQCGKHLHATDVFCAKCGWSLPTGRPRPSEELFPDFVPDT